jgi:membrane-associated protease RseP (regulator of RpoE activity)
MRIALVTTLVLASSVSAMAAQNGYQTINNPENRPMLGVQMTPVPLSTQEQQGLAPNQGVYVQSVYPNTAAETMGLQPGDVITSINGAPIGSMSELRNEVSLNQIGDPVEVTVMRGGQEQGTIGQFQPWPANIPYDPIDPAMEDRFREWQDRRLARMQEEADQLRNQAKEMAKQLKDGVGESDRGIFGINEKPPMGADGLPMSWRFLYRIGDKGPVSPNAEMLTASEETSSSTPTVESNISHRNWRFDWQLLSNRPTQEPL